MITPSDICLSWVYWSYNRLPILKPVHKAINETGNNPADQLPEEAGKGIPLTSGLFRNSDNETQYGSALKKLPPFLRELLNRFTPPVR